MRKTRVPTESRPRTQNFPIDTGTRYRRHTPFTISIPCIMLGNTHPRDVERIAGNVILNDIFFYLFYYINNILELFKVTSNVTHGSSELWVLLVY